VAYYKQGAEIVKMIGAIILANPVYTNVTIRIKR
jgi:hypothetical protein